MRDDQDRTLRALHDLAAACNDAAEGYGKAAKSLHDGALSNRLVEISDAREQFAKDLEDVVSGMGGQARQDLHEGGLLHRGWVDLEQSSRPKQTPEILQECIDGDTGTLKHYDHALSFDLPVQARSVVERQREAIVRDLAELASGGKSSAQSA